MLNTHKHTHTHSATQRGPETPTPTDEGLRTPSPSLSAILLRGLGQSPDPGMTPPESHWYPKRRGSSFSESPETPGGHVGNRKQLCSDSLGRARLREVVCGCPWDRMVAAQL